MEMTKPGGTKGCFLFKQNSFFLFQESAVLFLRAEQHSLPRNEMEGEWVLRGINYQQANWKL